MITQDAPFIDRRILLQAKSLITNGYDVTIIYPFGDVNDDFDSVGIKYIKVYHHVVKIKNSFSFVKYVVRKILSHKSYERLKSFYFKYTSNNFIDYEHELKQLSVDQNYDIYVAHDLPALPIAHYASKIMGAKLVYDSHEFFTGQISLQGARKTFFEKLEHQLIHDVDLMFTVNRDIADLFYDEYNLRNIKVLHNSIEEVSHTKKINLHQMLAISENKKILLYQGGFFEGRNLEILVESSKYLDEDNILVMLGYSFLEEKLKKLAKKLDLLNKKVYFMERVEQKELLNYTAGATMGVIPYPDIDLNTKFCTPNKMFEFITAGIPIVANEQLITVNNFIMAYSIGSLVSFENCEILGKGLNSTLNNFDYIRAEKYLEKAKDILSWDNQKNILIEAYGQL